MSFWYQLPYNKVNRIQMYCNSFSLHESDEELMTLPKMALGVMIMNHENILLDLEDENKPVKKYWSSQDLSIYTKEVFELKVPNFNETIKIKKKVLCISKPPVEVALTAEMFQRVVLRAAILNRIRGDDCTLSQIGPEYQLNSTKSIIFHDDGTFSVFDKCSPNQFQMQLRVLIELIIQRKKILADINSQDSTGENEYEKDGTLTLKTIPHENSRAFRFWLEGPVEHDETLWVEEEITLRKHTFDLMLHVALGAPMWKEGMQEDEKIKEARMVYWNSTPFNIVKKIEFSPDLKIFTIFNDVYNVMLSLPIAALKALLDRKAQVLSDLEFNSVAPSDEKDFIKEYWADEMYAIRTGVLYNLYREIDCNVVKFTRVESYECVFVAHKAGFLKLLQSYQKRRRNSKRR